ncbi:MAG: polysaccharide biosynthesis tyrosine autokinase [Candidatus Cloacimonetes bacterium]|nr:polysaccharide biosynthesis tyrosine autokinase [Candidatus Cloacimonadota bacterium]
MSMKNTELEKYQLWQFFIDVFYKEVFLILAAFVISIGVGSFFIHSRPINFRTSTIVNIKTNFVGDKELFPWIKESSEYTPDYIKRVLKDGEILDESLKEAKSKLKPFEVLSKLRMRDYLDETKGRQRVLGGGDKSKSSGASNFSLDMALSGEIQKDLQPILSNLISKFIDSENKKSHESLLKKLKIFTSQRNGVQEKLRDLIGRKTKYQESNNSLDIQAEMDSIIIFINKNMGVLERFDGELLVLQKRKAEVEVELKNRLKEEIDLSLFDKSYGELRNQLLELEAEKSVLRETYIEGHPKLRTIESRIRVLSKRSNELNKSFNEGSGRMSLDPVARALKQEIRGLNFKIAGQVQKRKSTAELITKEKNKYKRLNSAQSKILSLVDLERDLRNEESDLTKLIEIGSLNTSTVFVDFEYVKKVSDAVEHNNNFRKFGIPLLLVFGLISVAVILYTKYFFSGKFMRSFDVSKVLPQKVYGLIVGSKILDGNEIVCIESKTPVAESFRKLRANLNFHFSGLKSITISSAERGDGKSFVSVNLATSMAMMGKKVLLVDGDVRLPRDHLMLGLENLLGFVDLMDDCSLEDVIQDTKIKNLDFMSSGITSLNSADFLHSSRFDNILSMLEERYDFILFDTPPVAYATDAFIYAKKTTVTLFVLSIDKTKVVNVEKQLSELENLGIDNLGLVVNRVSEVELFGARNYRYYY